MNWIIEHFTIPQNGSIIQADYGTFEILSVTISICVSIMALWLNPQSREYIYVERRHIAAALGSTVLGAGVWAAHFLDMLTLDLPISVEYNWRLIAFSILPVIATSWFALRMISRANRSLPDVLIGGALIGCGVGVTHYIGMAAMELNILVRFNPWYFSFSFVSAIALASAALWLRYCDGNQADARPSDLKLNLLAGTIMGIAISSSHYLGMAATYFVVPTNAQQAGTADSQGMILALGIAVTLLIITFLVVAANMTFKYKDISRLAKAGETRIRAMMDTAVDGIITINASGLVESMNTTAEGIFGWHSGEIVGRNLDVLLPGLDEVNMWQTLKTSEHQRIGTSREVDALHRDGYKIPVRLAIGFVRLPEEILFVAFIEDIRERKIIELERKEDEAKFRSLISNIPGAAYRCKNDKQGHMIFISPAIETITGYAAADFVLSNPKRNFMDLVHPADRGALIKKGKFAYVDEYRIIRKDGTIRWILDNGDYVYDESGEIKWLDGFLMDITPRKEMEAQLLHAKENAEFAARSKSIFLANMTHEIRTPMNAIIGFSDLLLESNMTAEDHDALLSISNASKSLLQLLNNILDSSMLERGKVELVLVDFLIKELVDRVVATLKTQALQKQLVLIAETDPALNEHYFGAADRIQQVLLNLVGNAIKFTDKGSVTVRVQPAGGDNIRFSVTDTGIGISADRLEKIFDPFTQADSSMTRRFGGTGLGTSISRQLVELMGGSIYVTSEPGAGSCGPRPQRSAHAASA